MKKILIINGSPRVGQTKRAVDLFMQKLGDRYQFEVLNLRELDLQPCIGCAACLSRGEEFCPLKDGRNAVLQKMDEADGIVFATPNFALHVTNLMKNLFDRHAFVFHRPRFFKKAFTAIVTQGAYGGRGIDKYFRTTVGFWGGIYVPGAVLTLTSGSYVPANEWNSNEKAVAGKRLGGLAKRFAAMLDRQAMPSPSFFRVIMFRITRSAHKYGGEDNKDARHFRESGWFDSAYFYPARLGMSKRAAGWLVDRLAKLAMKKN